MLDFFVFGKCGQVARETTLLSSIHKSGFITPSSYITYDIPFCENVPSNITMNERKANIAKSIVLGRHPTPLTS